MSALRKARNKALRDEVFESLQEAIIAGSLAPGTRLVEAEIAAQLGVSKTPLREAIIRLERVGLVVSHPRRGTFVAQIGASTFRETLVVRTLIEGYAAAEAVPLLTDDDFSYLDSLVESIGKGFQRRDWCVVSSSDLAFHDHIYRKAGNRLLYDVWQSFSDQIRLYHRVSPEYQQWVSLRSNEDLHRELLEELRTRDPVRARQAAETHIRRGAMLLGLEVAEGLSVVPRSPR